MFEIKVSFIESLYSNFLNLQRILFMSVLFSFLSILCLSFQSPWQNIANCPEWPAPNRDRKTVVMASVTSGRHLNTGPRFPQILASFILGESHSGVPQAPPSHRDGGWSLGKTRHQKGQKARDECFCRIAGGSWRLLESVLSVLSGIAIRDKLR